MADEVNGHDGAMMPGLAPPRAIVQFVLTADGQILVSAPTTPNGMVDEVLALGLIERGRMLVEDKIRADQGKAGNLIERANGLPPQLRRMR